MNRSVLTQLPKIGLLLLATLFVAFTYTFLHESGHALVGLLSGGSIDVFNVSFWNMNAHVDMTGSLTPAQAVANNLAGTALPLMVWFLFMLAVPKRANFVLECIKVAGSLMVLSTLLSWIVLPMLFLAGQAPSDDVTNFLNNSGAAPLAVTGAALLVFIAGWLFFGTRIDGVRCELDLFRSPTPAQINPAERRTTLSMLGVACLCALTAFAANGFRLSAPRAADPYAPPPGYTLVEKIVLSEAAYDQAAVYTFTVEQPAKTGIFLLVEQIRSEYFEVRLSGPDGWEYQIIHAEGYTAERDVPHMEERLQPGTYSIILTSRRSPGTLSIYFSGEP